MGEEKGKKAIRDLELQLERAKERERKRLSRLSEKKRKKAIQDLELKLERAIDHTLELASKRWPFYQSFDVAVTRVKQLVTVSAGRGYVTFEEFIATKGIMQRAHWHAEIATRRLLSDMGLSIMPSVEQRSGVTRDRLENPDFLRLLFNTGKGSDRGEPIEYERLAYCIRNDIVSCRIEEYAQTPKPSEDDFAAMSVFSWAGKGRSDEEHQLLKWWAWNWCVKTYGKAPMFEVGAETGKVADASTGWGGVWIECGSTSPLPAYAGFIFHTGNVEAIFHGNGPSENSRQAFVLFPKEFNGYFAYIFEPTENGIAALTTYDRWVVGLMAWNGLWRKFADLLPKPKPPPEPGNLGDPTEPVNTQISEHQFEDLKQLAERGGWDEIRAQFRLGEIARDEGNFVEAYKWFDIASVGQAKEAKVEVAKNMTPEQIAEAQAEAKAYLREREEEEKRYQAMLAEYDD